MEGIANVIDLAQAGVSGVALVAVVALWRRLNTVTDRFTAYLEESAQRGDVAAQKTLDAR